MKMSYLENPWTGSLPATGAWQYLKKRGGGVMGATWVLKISDLERTSEHMNKTDDPSLMSLHNNKSYTWRQILASGNIPCRTFLSCPLYFPAFQPLAPMKNLSSPYLTDNLTNSDSGTFLEVDIFSLCISFILGPGRYLQNWLRGNLKEVWRYILATLISTWH